MSFGAGGGGGSSFTGSATNTSAGPDSSGVPSVTITYTVNPPSSTSAPSISGNTTQGQTLTETHGSWTNSPMSFAYQWEDCDSSGNACSAIAGATGQTYTRPVSPGPWRVALSGSVCGESGAGARPGGARVRPKGSRSVRVRGPFLEILLAPQRQYPRPRRLASGRQVGLQSMACLLGIVGRLSVCGNASVPFGLGVISAP